MKTRPGATPVLGCLAVVGSAVLGSAVAAAAGRSLHVIRVTAIVLGAVAALALWAVPAVAHNSLLSSNPSAGQRVSRVPAEIVLTFDEPAVAMGTRVEITGPSGPVHQGLPRSEGSTVTQELQAGAPAGTYTVDWRIASADGHPISGTFDFTAAAAGGGRGATTEPAPSPGGPEETRSAVAPWLVAALLSATAAGVLLALRRRRSGPSRRG
jgi:methionine-rich copper-binding protein CopC